MAKVFSDPGSTEPWTIKKISEYISALYPVTDLYPHDVSSAACRCKPEVQKLGNGYLLISHNMMMSGWFIPKSRRRDEENS